MTDPRPPSAGDDRPRPVFSRLYAAAAARMERGGMAQLRDELLAGLHGEVVEVGAGHGLNFAHYPRTVTRVVAVEPEPRLRELAQVALRLDRDDLGDRVGVVGEVEPVAGADLDDPSAEAFEQAAAVIGRAAPFGARGGLGVHAREPGPADVGGCP